MSLFSQTEDKIQLISWSDYFHISSENIIDKTTLASHLQTRPIHVS